MTFCDDCNSAPTGSQFGPLPPCHGESCSIEWEDVRTTSPAGRIVPKAKLHPQGALECVSDTDGEGLGVRVYGDTAEMASSGCANPLHRDPTDNSLWVEPFPIKAYECAEGGGCESVAPGGKADAVYTGCATAVEATITNTHCSARMRVIPKLTVIGAELDGGVATYQFQVGSTLVPLFTSIETKVAHVPGDDIGHNVTQDTPATYSGTVELAPIELNPGQSYTLSATPQVRYRNDGTGDVNVTWGTYRLCLDGTTI